MAKSYYGREEECKVGSLVYAPYKPLNPGVVTRVVMAKNKDTEEDERYLDVDWSNPAKGGPDRTRVWYLNLNDFDALIAEHKRKYEKFVAMRAAVVTEDC